jgi:transposase
MVGDRGMIKSGQIEALLGHGFYYITAITKPQIDTLLDQDIIQMELFSEELCEIEYDEVRYILKRNPVRAKELEDVRKDKIEKIGDFIHDRNQYLDEHPRAVITVAVSRVKELIEKLKLSSFLSVQTDGRVLSLTCDDDALEEAIHLDGCYVIKSNVPRDAVRKEIIHERYKDLAYVESAFRNMKTTQLEIRPVNVRKASRTRGHVFIVMLSYFISKYLREKWAEFDLTVEEGINELSTICCIETHVGAVAYNQIPEPRDLGLQLINSLNITLPPAIQCRGINVATRKKLNLKRKSH